MILNSYILSINKVEYLQFLQHFDFALYAGSPISIISKPVNKFLNMGSMLLLCLKFSLLIPKLFRLGLLKVLVVTSAQQRQGNFVTWIAEI
jgi:hypothetical protein